MTGQVSHSFKKGITLQYHTLKTRGFQTESFRRHGDYNMLVTEYLSLCIADAVPQCSILGSLHFLLYISDPTTSINSPSKPYTLY
jgi:hypothetical protein